METVAFLLLGHFLAALLLYLNHRFIFHGQLGNTKILRPWRKVHTLHHKYDYVKQWRKFALIPWWGWISLSAVCCIIGYYTNIFFGIGLFSYLLSYEITHYYLHKYPTKNYLNEFHHFHHRKSAKKNFATFWTFFDRIFGTYKFDKGSK
jgi:sterol desaturase/sphingolipid hydroxylase (fatty acid hydroxylase superfamily)